MKATEIVYKFNPELISGGITIQKEKIKCAGCKRKREINPVLARVRDHCHDCTTKIFYAIGKLTKEQIAELLKNSKC